MPERLGVALAGIVVAGLVLFCALSPIWEMDVFWHVSVGRWIVEHRALPTMNVWSAADPTQPYHPAQWLWEAVAALLDRRGGLEALRLANAAFITGSFVLAFVLLRRYAPTWMAAVFCLLLFAAFHDRVRVRPHVINFTGELLLTFFVARVATVRPAHLVATFLGFFLWASLHAGGAWMMVLALAGLGLFVLVFERRRGVGKGREGWLLVALAAGLGWLLSPGSTAWIGVHDDAAIGYVEEWRAWPAMVSGLGPIKLPHLIVARAFLPVAVVLFFVVARRWRRASTEASTRERLGAPRELVWAAACLALGASAWRFFYFAGLALLALFLATRRLDEGSWSPSRRARLGLVGLGVLVAAITIQYETADYASVSEAWASRGTTVDERYFPALGTQLLVESGLSARVATLPSWGGYVAYAGWPKLTTTIDGRFIAPDEVKELTRAILTILDSGRGVDALPGLYGKLPADFVLMPRRRHTARLPMPDWVKVATGPVEDLYMRKAASNASWIQALRTIVERHRLSGLPGHGD